MKRYTAEEAKKLYKKGMKWGCYNLNYEFPVADCILSTPSFNMPDTHYYVLDLPNDDKINKPKHYYIKVEGVDIDCRAVQRQLGMYQHHALASAFAYLWRCLHKDDTVADIKKAINFLQEELLVRGVTNE